MNKAMKKNLEAVVNSLVNEDTKGATKAFHDYLQAKSQTMLMNESPYDDEDSDEFGGADGRFQDDSFDGEDDEDFDDLNGENTDFGDDEDDEDFYEKHPESLPDSQEITDRYNDPRYVGH